MAVMQKNPGALLAVDQGTTSSRSILFSPEGDVLALKQKELQLHYPHKGWVEQNPDDIWNDTLWTCRDVVQEAKKQGLKIFGKIGRAHV